MPVLPMSDKEAKELVDEGLVPPGVARSGAATTAAAATPRPKKMPACLSWEMLQFALEQTPEECARLLSPSSTTEPASKALPAMGPRS